jgi:hypothetical protein
MCKDHENGFASLTEQNQKHCELVSSLSTLAYAKVDVSDLVLLTMTQWTCSSPL